MARRVFITGISGQDGSYLAERALAEGSEVIGVVRPGGSGTGLLPEAAAAKVKTVSADLGDPGGLRRAVAETQPDEIYHLAAPTFVPASWEAPERVIAEIAGATGAILRAAADLPAPARVFVATSSEIFGHCGVSPQNELTAMRPRSPYGVAKLAAHGLVGVLRRRLGLFAVSGILFNHESPRRPENFLPRKVTRGVAEIAAGHTSELVLGSQDAIRDWSHADDMMRGAMRALSADEPRDYVFASGRGRTVADLVRTAFEAAGVPPEERRVHTDERFVRPPEATAPVGDPARARELLGWEPRIGFEELIGEMVAADAAALARTT